MERLLAFASNLMTKLSAIPGLRFLDTYVTEARQARTQVAQVVDDNVTYVKTAQSAVGDIGRAAGGSVDQNEEDEWDQEMPYEDEELDE